MRNLRNVAIVMLLALVVAFAPAGRQRRRSDPDRDHDGLPGRRSPGCVYVLSRQNQLTLATLSDGRRAILYGGAGHDRAADRRQRRALLQRRRHAAWILLLAASVAAIWRIWIEANTY